MTVYNSTGYDADSSDALFNTGVYKRVVRAAYSKPASDQSDNVVILARNLPLDAKITNILLPNGCAASTGETDYDFGFYKSSDNAVLDKDAVLDGQSFASALAAGKDLVAYAKAVQSVGDLLGLNADEAYSGGVDLCMTINSAGTAAVSFDFEVGIVFPA